MELRCLQSWRLLVENVAIWIWLDDVWFFWTGSRFLIVLFLFLYYLVLSFFITRSFRVAMFYISCMRFHLDSLQQLFLWHSNLNCKYQVFLSLSLRVITR